MTTNGRPNGSDPTDPSDPTIEETMAILRVTIPAMTLNKNELALLVETCRSQVILWNDDRTIPERTANDQRAQTLLSEILSTLVQIGKDRKAA